MVAHLASAVGRACDFVRTDVTHESQVKALIDFTMKCHGRVDCLFNNAGSSAPVGGIEGIAVEGFDDAVAVLLRSVMLGMKHVAPIMTRQRAGSILNNGSIAGTRAGYSSSIIYSAAKAAVIQLSKCVAMQLGEHQVRVNSISPGGIATGIFGKALGLSVEKAELTADAVKAGSRACSRSRAPGSPTTSSTSRSFLRATNRPSSTATTWWSTAA